MTNITKAKLILRAGLAFVFVYAGISGLVDPLSWIGFFPAFIFKIVSAQMAMPVFSLLEILLGFWVLSGVKIFWSTIIVTVLTVTIIVFNTSQFLVVFRDVGILAASIALLFLSKD